MNSTTKFGCLAGCGLIILFSDRSRIKNDVLFIFKNIFGNFRMLFFVAGICLKRLDRDFYYSVYF